MLNRLAKGALNLGAKPEPAHEQTLARLRYWTKHLLQESGYTCTEREIRELAAMEELAARIVGTSLPVEFVGKIYRQLLLLRKNCEFEESRIVVDDVRLWLNTNYRPLKPDLPP